MNPLRPLLRSRTIRVTYTELRGLAAERGWRHAVAAFLRLVAGVVDECPRGKSCPSRGTCDAGAIRCLRDGPFWP